MSLPYSESSKVEVRAKTDVSAKDSKTMAVTLTDGELSRGHDAHWCDQRQRWTPLPAAHPGPGSAIQGCGDVQS